MKQVALVTGAAQGLGLIIGQALYNAGFNVVLSDTNEALVKSVAQSIDPTAQAVIGIKLDVCQKADFVDALAITTETFGARHILVNNAAITPTTALMDISPEEFSQVLDINLRGTFLACQVFGDYFSKQVYGRIINLASLAGQMGGTASGAHYASSKAGIITLSKIFARQFAGQGVTVNAIAPGPVDVPSIRDKVPAEKLDHIINNMIPVKAMSEPEFIADMVILLSRKNANTVTGATWDVNGGIYMR